MSVIATATKIVQDKIAQAGELESAQFYSQVDMLRLDLGRITSIHHQLDERIARSSQRSGQDLRIIDVGALADSHGTAVAREMIQPLIDKIHEHREQGWQASVREVIIKGTQYQFLFAERGEVKS